MGKSKGTTHYWTVGDVLDLGAAISLVLGVGMIGVTLLWSIVMMFLSFGGVVGDITATQSILLAIGFGGGLFFLAVVGIYHLITEL